MMLQVLPVDRTYYNRMEHDLVLNLRKMMEWEETQKQPKDNVVWNEDLSSGIIYIEGEIKLNRRFIIKDQIIYIECSWD
jgi:hypothetical protein